MLGVVQGAAVHSQTLAGEQTQPADEKTQPLEGEHTQTHTQQLKLLRVEKVEEELSEELDCEGLETRAVLGEQTPAEENKDAERWESAQADPEADDSEAEERVFKAKVVAVIRVHPPHWRRALVPRARFSGQPLRPVGLNSRHIMLNMPLHMRAMWNCKSFLLGALVEKDNEGRWFAPRRNNEAITRKHDILEREPLALKGSKVGGWFLVDELPDTDQLTGELMDPTVFAGRWQNDLGSVIKHLLKKHEGDLVEWS